MSKEKNIIHSEGDCLTEKTLFDYIDNKLSQKDRHIVEKHLLDCELCSDALEGLEMVKDRGRITFIKEEINKRILSSPKEEAKVVAFNYKVVFSVAATIALLVVGVFLFKQMNVGKEMSSDLAELKETESSPEFAPPPPPPPAEPDQAIDGSGSSVTEDLEQTELNGLKGEDARWVPGKGLADQKTPVAEQQEEGYYKTGEVAAAESQNEVMTDEVTVADNEASRVNDATVSRDDYRKQNKDEKAPAAPKAVPADGDKLLEATKAEEKAATGNSPVTYNWNTTPDQNNRQQPDEDRSASGTSANNNTTTKATGNTEFAKKSDDGKFKSGVKRSEQKPVESTGKNKKSAGKESSADDDLALGGAVGYEPESIVKEKEKLAESEGVVTLSTTTGIFMDSVSVVQKTVLIDPEKMPEYPQGEAAMLKFIQTNFKYDVAKYKANPPASNKIFVTFTVDVDGSLQNAKVLKGIDPVLDAEALRVVKLMPKWKPAELNGKAHSTQMNLPIKLEFK